MADHLRQGQFMSRMIVFGSKSYLHVEARRTVVPASIPISISIGVGGTKGAVATKSSTAVAITAITMPIPSVMTHDTA